MVKPKGNKISIQIGDVAIENISEKSSLKLMKEMLKEKSIRSYLEFHKKRKILIPNSVG